MLGTQRIDPERIMQAKGTPHLLIAFLDDADMGVIGNDAPAPFPTKPG